MKRKAIVDLRITQEAQEISAKLAKLNVEHYVEQSTDNGYVYYKMLIGNQKKQEQDNEYAVLSIGFEENDIEFEPAEFAVTFSYSNEEVDESVVMRFEADTKTGISDLIAPSDIVPAMVAVIYKKLGL